MCPVYVLHIKLDEFIKRTFKKGLNKYFGGILK